MAKHRTGGPAHPWRRTARTVFQAAVGLAALAPFVYTAATQQEPEAAYGGFATALAVSAGVTRVMALPGVEQWLQRFLPFLAADDVDIAEVAVRVADEPGVQLVAGPASSLPDGTPVAVERA